MKYSFLKSLQLFLLLFVGVASYGQQSVNTVNYKVTYDPATQIYTTWVIPNYSVPNTLNTGTTEKGATAQFTLIVPKTFIISNITDIRGIWEKTPLKLGPGQPSQDWSAYPSLDPNSNYYVVGKSPSESDYGTFTQGQAVSLFTFKGNGCFGPIVSIPTNSPFIAAAEANYSLGVANSFYSRSGQPAGGNQNPLEQFSAVSGGPAICDNTPIVLANPETPTTPNGSSTTTNVLSNDKINGNPVSITDVNVTIDQQPTNGTVVVNADGTIKYTPTGTFTGTDCYVYKVCSKTTTTACDTAKVCVTVQAPIVGNKSTDLRVSKKVNTKSAAINDVLTYTVVVKNTGLANATNIVVSDSLGAGLSYISATASKGTFSNPTWSIPSIMVGDSAILTVSAKVLSEGISFNYAKLVSPVKLCTGDKIELSAPANYSSVTWYKDGSFVGTGNTLLVGTSGSYTVSATNSSCPATGCCPIVVIVADCCVPVCVPMVIKRLK
jgi:uncharacterized repeat protein (TIGR01451 family)